MKLRNTLTGIVANLRLERPASKTTLVEQAAKLQMMGLALAARYAAAADTPANRERLRHITGIERWGQSRLRVALGEPLMMDEYDDYRPPADLSWPDLQAAFEETRQATVALIEQLHKAGAAAVKTPHNQFGDLTVRGWLAYLNNHANLESKKIR